MRDKNGRYAVVKEKEENSTASFQSKPINTNKKEWIYTLFYELYWIMVRLLIRMVIDVMIFFILISIMNRFGVIKFFSDIFYTIKDTAEYVHNNINQFKEEVKNGSYGNKFVD